LKRFLRAFEEVQRLGICSQGNNRFFPFRRAADVTTYALLLGRYAECVNLFYFNAEDFFDRCFDFSLVRFQSYLKSKLVFFHQISSALGDNRTLDNVACVLHYANTSSTLATASLVMTSAS